MSTIRVEDLQRDLLAVLRRVEAGESFLVVSGDHPVAEVRPVSAPVAQPRPAGQGTDQLQASDNVARPLPHEVIEDFERE